MIKDLKFNIVKLQRDCALFGIILFNDSHPHIVKLLKDNDYYKALDELSGSHLAIFATVLFKPALVEPPPGVVHHMVPIWKEPKQNTKLFNLFEIKDSGSLPMFVLFNGQGSDLYFQKHPIIDTSIEETWNSLKEIIEPIVKSIDKNLEEEMPEIFKKAQWQMRRVTAKNVVKRILGLVGSLRGIAGI
ncbi:MAG: hypothetical protein KDE56_16300 [Anaerolineales bacterium]|nr:hypothetical protein [Anaerolineales bacterium]